MCIGKAPVDGHAFNYVINAQIADHVSGRAEDAVQCLTNINPNSAFVDNGDAPINNVANLQINRLTSHRGSNGCWDLHAPRWRLRLRGTILMQLLVTPRI